MGASVRVPSYHPKDARYEYKKHARGGAVPVYSDAKSNAEVRAVIGKEPPHAIQGAPSAERAQRVLQWIKGQVQGLAADREVCIVDGSGEFGAFDDDLAEVQATFRDLGGVGHFDERGQLVAKERRIRYYSHRDARGVDSEMADTAIGFVVLASRTRLSDAAQAVYRLRRLAHGQTVRIVLASEGAAGSLSLVDMLIANEQEHAERAEPVLMQQLAHAEKRKPSSVSFERNVTIYDGRADALRTSEKEQQQTQEKVEVATGNPKQKGCFAARADPTTHATLQNGVRTGISADLAVLRVGLSPFLTYAGWVERKETRRRAFAVVGDQRLVVMALAEVWTRFGGEKTAYVAYASDGRKLRGSSEAPRGLLLFGRYLCDGGLSLLEEYELLAFLRSRYAQSAERRALQKVVSCLWSSRFLVQPTKMLHRLAEGLDAGAGKKAEDVLEHIRREMFGGSDALDAALEPYAAAIAASAAFGKRRFV
jgi:hypothetical protein